jgi:hypothetical protein
LGESMPPSSASATFPERPMPCAPPR